jgi:uncharacterized membrane protein
MGFGRFNLALFIMPLFLVPAWAWPAGAETGPARALSAAFNYPGLIVGPEETMDLGLSIGNRGQADDSFVVTVLEKPEDWETELRVFSNLVTGLFLGGGQEANPVLRVRPSRGGLIRPGDYDFRIRVQSLDGFLSRESACRVTVRARAATLKPLILSSTHPELRGPSDGRFSFSLDVKNQGEGEALVGLSAEGPAGWELYFKPSYEDKQITSIQIPQGQSRALALELRPDYRAGAGLFPIKVRAESKWGSAETELRLELTGTYQIRLIPANELLSAATGPGQPVSLNFFLLNEGTAPQREVRLVSVAPDNWTVVIEPPVIPFLEPGRLPRPVTLTVTPAAGALIGDYGLGLAAEGQRSKSSLDLRLTVKAKSVWAWLGTALIVLTVLALVWTFRRLGRR